MPALSKLLLLAVSPRTVIAKRDSKYADYSRYIASRNARRPVDKQLLASANEFVAIHTQLVEELPAFLEGYTRIFDLTVVGFAKAQASYNASIRDRLSGFLKEWISLPRRKSSHVVNLDDDLYDVSDARGIVEAWQGAWSPYAEAMDHFQCTRPCGFLDDDCADDQARHTASRVASFNNRPGSRTASTNSRSNSPLGSPMLRHSSSITSTHSRTDSVRQTTNRNRSTSLIGQSDSELPISPIKADSRFAMLRRNSKTKVSDSLMPPPAIPANQKRSSTLMSLARDPGNRHSFGLPQIATDKPLFEALKLSPVKSSTHSPSLTIRASTAPVGHSASPDMMGDHPFNEFGVGSGSRSATSTSKRNAGLGLGDLDRDRTMTRGTDYSHKHPFATPASPTPRTPLTMEIDASEGWRNEKVIYQCGCVAEL